jgi:hypothetical protein
MSQPACRYKFSKVSTWCICLAHFDYVAHFTGVIGDYSCYWDYWRLLRLLGLLEILEIVGDYFNPFMLHTSLGIGVRKCLPFLIISLSLSLSLSRARARSLSLTHTHTLSLAGCRHLDPITAVAPRSYRRDGPSVYGTEREREREFVRNCLWDR